MPVVGLNRPLDRLEGYELRSTRPDHETEHGKSTHKAESRLTNAPGIRAAVVENLRQAESSLTCPMNYRLRHRQATARDAFLEQRDQAFRVAVRISRFGEHLIVTSHLALQ